MIWPLGQPQLLGPTIDAIDEYRFLQIDAQLERRLAGQSHNEALQNWTCDQTPFEVLYLESEEQSRRELAYMVHGEQCPLRSLFARSARGLKPP
jgi:hypothetical protein